MEQIRISDVTMKRTGSAPEFSLSFREKIELAKLLDRLGVSVIELDGIESAKIDSLLIKSVAAAVRDGSVAVPVLLSGESVENTWSALREARHPRLQVFAPVSPVQMEYLFHKKPEAMLDAIRETVSACRARCADVEFLAGDATRSDESFLAAAVTAAAEAGAVTVTVCDTAGAMLPDEFAAFLARLAENAPALRDVTLGALCSNDLAMADACAVAAIRGGAREIKTAACGTQTASLASLARLLAAKGEQFGASCGIRMTELLRIVGQIARMCQTSRSRTSPFDNGVQSEDEGVFLTSHDDAAAVRKAAERLGYDLTEEDVAKVFEAFRRIVEKKERVGAKELDAIVAAAALQVPPTYKLESYVINTGNIISATAHIRLRTQERTVEGISAGDGPVDAAFLAVEQIAGRHFELDDFQIQAVTEGREAMGQTVVKLRSGGRVYSGRGISTDILGASILAYINALNKIVYEEAEA